MASIPSLQSFTLDLPPSCIAFCPVQPQYCVIGTYFLHPKQHSTPQQLQQVPQEADDAESEINDRESDNAFGGPAMTHNAQREPQKRTGSLILFRLEDGDARAELKHLCSTVTDFAILDIQWTPHKNGQGGLLAAATSTGSLAFFRLEIQNGDAELVCVSVRSVAEPSVLVLSLAWHPVHPHVIGLTFSDGRVCLCETTEGNLWMQDSVVSLTEIHRHNLEAWTLAFAGNEGDDVLSGGDDAVLQHSGVDSQQERTEPWRDRKLHEAGVTAILPLGDGLVVTGSYDDHIRLISASAVGRRRLLAERNLGGGVWRLKLISRNDPPIIESVDSRLDKASTSSSSKSFILLASCMHAGSRVVRLCKDVEDGEWVFEVLARFEEHESMNYGSDVRPEGDKTTSKTLVSIGFYDKSVCVWQFDSFYLTLP